MAMDVIDYFIYGDDMQFVEIELDPGEAAIGEAGSMMYMEDGIAMDTVFGDASAEQSGLFGKLVGAGKRLITGESLMGILIAIPIVVTSSSEVLALPAALQSGRALGLAIVGALAFWLYRTGLRRA